MVTSLAGFESAASVVTSLAGFAGARRPQRTGWSYRDPGRLQVSACCFSTHTSGLLDAPQRPSELPQCDDLLFLFFAQDIAHADGGYRPSRQSQCPGFYRWPVFR